ncbi:MAG TPA: Bax inhibitor-1/YccA family protein [Candidatus Omnitrophota bacterium]|nr:Bax inhibitor-1/YccA family protein [Candidatus Omnitrophota bacterium]HPS37665.1 Bax inhibitor-1/YccA family protein [Candidatus Omnitrophota bacterium]
MNSQNEHPFSYSRETVFSNFMQRVYQWMALGLSLTGLMAFATLLNVGLLKFLLKGGMWLFLIAEIALVFWLSASIRRISARAAVTGFLVYSALNGITISTIFLAYTTASVSSTFFIAALTFAGVSVYGWMTKQDLTSVGSFCFMALWGVIIASVLNFFFRAPVFYWILSYCGVAVFIGLTAYDTQRLKAIHQSTPNAPEQIAIYGALMLYLDFINMFLWLLQIFGRRR